MKISILILLFFAIIMGSLSCKNKDYPPPVSLITTLVVANATADTLNFYLNGTRQNNLSDLYPGGASGYIHVKAGLQNYQFKRSGTAPVLFSVPYTLDTAKFYSMFIAGETADKIFLRVDPLDSVAAIIHADTTSSIAMIRFVNASPNPNAGTLDVTTTGLGDTVNIKNCSFKYTGSFIQVKGGAINVKVYQTGANTPLIDTALTLQTGGAYTLFAKGLLNGKGNAALNISLMTNGNY